MGDLHLWYVYTYAHTLLIFLTYIRIHNHREILRYIENEIYIRI